MKLQVLLPVEVFLDEEVVEVSAEAPDGAFCLLPRHIDFVTPLNPGVLSYRTDDRREVFVAVDEGLLVKRGEEVLVSTRRAASGPELGRLRQTVEQEYEKRDENEVSARNALYKIEASFVQRFIELQEHG